MQYIYISAMLISCNIFSSERIVSGDAKRPNPRPTYQAQHHQKTSAASYYAALCLMSMKREMPVDHILCNYCPAISTQWYRLNPRYSQLHPSRLLSFSRLPLQQHVIHQSITTRDQSQPDSTLPSTRQSPLPPLTLGGSRPTTKREFGSLKDYKKSQKQRK